MAFDALTTNATLNLGDKIPNIMIENKKNKSIKSKRKTKKSSTKSTNQQKKDNKSD